MTKKIQDLEAIQRLIEVGALSQEEFEAEKSRILGVRGEAGEQIESALTDLYEENESDSGPNRPLRIILAFLATALIAFVIWQALDPLDINSSREDAEATERAWASISSSNVCLGVFTTEAYPAGDDGTPMERCFQGIEPGSPQICQEPRLPGEVIQPSQIWSKQGLGARTACEHGGYCYLIEDIRLNAACSTTKDVARYSIPDAIDDECPYIDPDECTREEEVNRNR